MFSYPARGLARVKGVEEFECGHCPECLQKKSRLWALRCAMEARVNDGVMVTLTYDTYKNIKTFEENPVDTSLKVCKKDCQDFLKRLRAYYSDKKIKYILTAEYGKRTHRAHYHALLFGVKFDDLRQYKKSKRGNIIYKSPTLEKIWNNGICTVDCINLSAKTARYCTKYCAKDSGVDDTFMLFSRGIGEEELMRLFNGKSYWIDGREYPIPREIWKKYIEQKYNIIGYSRYVNKVHLVDTERYIYHAYERYYNTVDEKKVNELYAKKARYEKHLKKYEEKERNARKRYTRHKYAQMCIYYADLLSKIESALKVVKNAKKKLNKEVDMRVTALENREIPYKAQEKLRHIYIDIRDNDPLYIAYIQYWNKKSEVYKITRPAPIERVLSLPENKYRSYKHKAITALINRAHGRSFVPPRSNCSHFAHTVRTVNNRKVYLSFGKEKYLEKSFAVFPRHYTANDKAINSHFRIIADMCKIDRLKTAKTKILLEQMQESELYVPYFPLRLVRKVDYGVNFSRNLSEILQKPKISSLQRLRNYKKYAKI